MWEILFRTAWINSGKTFRLKAKNNTVHATLAVAQGGRPLGVCALEGDFRESVEAKAAREPGVAQEPESARWLRSLEQAAAVGHACSNTRVISVADREGDIWTSVLHCSSC